jgi:hypothetical protein
MLSLVLQVGACKKINMLYLRHLFRCQRSIIDVLAVAAICSAPKETMTPSPLACPTFLLLTFGDAMRTPYNLFCSAGGRSWPISDSTPARRGGSFLGYCGRGDHRGARQRFFVFFWDSVTWSSARTIRVAWRLVSWGNAVAVPAPAKPAPPAIRRHRLRWGCPVR